MSLDTESVYVTAREHGPIAALIMLYLLDHPDVESINHLALEIGVSRWSVMRTLNKTPFKKLIRRRMIYFKPHKRVPRRLGYLIALKGRTDNT